MEFDAASMFAVGCFLAFIGAIVWAEVHSRRQRRQARQVERAPENEE